MEREEAHTCTNHPIINNVHGVGGRPQFSEGWGVRWGAGDQQFGPGQQLSSLLWASPLLQLAPRLLQLLCTEKTDERRPISLSPAQMVLKQSAACYQIMRREQLLWTIKWKDYVWLYSIWILKREKKNNHKYNHYYCTALFLETSHFCSPQVISIFLRFQDKQTTKHFCNALHIADRQIFPDCPHKDYWVHLLFAVSVICTITLSFLFSSSFSLLSNFCMSLQNLPVWWRLS